MTLNYPRQMTGEDYVKATLPAVTKLYEAINSELERLEFAKVAYGKLLTIQDQEFSRHELNDDSDEIKLMHTHAQLQETRMTLAILDHSVEALAGAILQIAKQGISMLLEGKTRFESGPLIGGQHLSAIIWHARNQAMHWEEGLPTNKQTMACFQLLAEEVGEEFDLSTSDRNCALGIMQLLGCHGPSDYTTIMGRIVPK